MAMDLKLETLLNSICADDVEFKTTMDVTSFAYEDVNGKRTRKLDGDGNPIVDWEITGAKAVISYAGCDIKKILEAANRQFKIQIQRSRNLTREQFIEMLKTPFYVREMTAKRPVGVGAYKTINTMAEKGDVDGIKTVMEFAEKRLAEIESEKKTNKEKS